MRGFLQEMQTALAASVDENRLLNDEVTHARDLARRLEASEARGVDSDQRASEIVRLRAALRDANVRNRVIQGEAQAAIAEVATLRDTVQRHVTELEHARETTSEGNLIAIDR